MVLQEKLEKERAMLKSAAWLMLFVSIISLGMGIYYIYKNNLLGLILIALSFYCYHTATSFAFIEENRRMFIKILEVTKNEKKEK